MLDHKFGIYPEILAFGATAKSDLRLFFQAKIAEF